jgi:AI-2 transport protein TqsA
MNTVKFPFYVRLPLILLSILLILLILTLGATIFIPLFFSLLIAILLFPLCRVLEEKLRLGRFLAAMLSVTFFFTSLTGFVYFIVLKLVVFSNDIPTLRLRFTEMFASLQHWLSHKLHITTRQQTAYINKTTTTLIDSLGQSAGNVFVSVSGILLLLIFVIIFTFFILYYRKLLMSFTLNLFSEPNRIKVTEVVTETKSMINAYILGLVIEMVVMGAVSIGMFLIMDIEYPLLLGIMVALLNVIPYLGIYSAICIVMLVTFANSTGDAALQAGAGVLVIHILDANILFPRLIGGRVKMNPFITILAVIVGEQLWGIPGMFLFIPIAGIIKLVCERVTGLTAWGILMGVDEQHKETVPETNIVEE